MLETLTIKNFGIIEYLSLELTPGLNVLTGETGAGKSILIDALRFSLGERFQASFVRDQADQCLVAAVFRPKAEMLKECRILEDFPSDDGTLILQRSVTSDGKNRVKINGLNATVSQLKELGDQLIDFHGPHDHQLLLAENRHLGLLDSLTSFGKSLGLYRSAYEEFCRLNQEISSLQDMARTRERDLELLTHQVRELEQLPLDEAQLAQMESDQLKVNNSEKLYENLTLALSTLSDDENGVETTLARACKPLEALAAIDNQSAAGLEHLSAAQDQLQQLVSFLRNYADSLHFDPEYAKDINLKIDLYRDIKRKYGPTLADAENFYQEAKHKLELLSDFEHNTSALEKKRRQSEKELTELAADLTKQRKKSAAMLKKTIEKELTELGFKSVLFEVKIERGSFGPAGSDQVTFFISPNTGESLKPLAEIVSSGESARIMLAIKKALMAVDPVPVLIFDEIDAQIGGRLGTTIGNKLKEISAYRQVILITHLPQIAAFADTHFKIQKTTEAGRTKTMASLIEGKYRVEELAHMMSGDALTAVSLKHAKDMLEQAGNSDR